MGSQHLGSDPGVPGVGKTVVARQLVENRPLDKPSATQAELVTIVGKNEVLSGKWASGKSPWLSIPNITIGKAQTSIKEKMDVYAFPMVMSKCAVSKK